MTCHGMSALSATPAQSRVIVLRQNKYFRIWKSYRSSDMSHPRTGRRFNLGLGEKEKALDWLEKAYEDRDPIFWWIDGDQLYDSVRNEPRFQALVQKIDGTKAE